jgi:aerobic carbon-monoxide dehydrogenase small subunit
MDSEKAALRFSVNGRRIEVASWAGTALIDVLRDDLGLMGTHAGCRNGDCGACTVLVDGLAFKSCLVPGFRVADRDVETLDGLAKDGVLHSVQRTFWEANAFQCGFCLSGNILCIVELLRSNPTPELSDVEDALKGNLCRCTGYQQIAAAALLAAEEARLHVNTDDIMIEPSSVSLV